MSSSLKFGTSGLRGLVTELTDAVCFSYSVAFLEHLLANGLAAGSTVLVGQDLRDSSPRIANACMAAVEALGMNVENCGTLPTPALALRAMKLKVPAIMVTGSHIPADRHGLKFYRPDGEIDKADEAEINRRVASSEQTSPLSGGEKATHPDAVEAYLARSRLILVVNSLSGKRIGVYQHSSVARDLMVQIVSALGGEAIVLSRSDVFVPVDTEALRPKDLALAKAAVPDHRLDALISTDGDGDRPMLFDEKGQFVRGDLLGILTAKFLGADAVVTPVTSTSAIEQSDLFKTVVRTKVGSPFVIAGMEEAKRQGGQIVVGFEANGGVLLGSDVALPGGTLTALPTRDAMLPMLSVLGLGLKEGKTVSELVAALPARFAASGRLEHVGPDKTGPFLNKLQDRAFQTGYFASKGDITAVDQIDGIRFVFESGDTVHYRASGNAPELRCYAETGDFQRSAELLAWGLEKAAAAL